MSAKLSRLLACESEPSDAEDEVDVDADDDEDVDEDEDAGVVVDAVELVGAEDRAADEDDEEEEARLVDVVEGVQAGEDQVLVGEGLGVQAGVLEVEVFLPLLSSSSEPSLAVHDIWKTPTLGLANALKSPSLISSPP